MGVFRSLAGIVFPIRFRRRGGRGLPGQGLVGWIVRLAEPAVGLPIAVPAMLVRLILPGVPLPMVVASTLLLVLTVLPLLGLLAAFLLGAFMKGGGQVLQGADKMNAEITLGFMRFLDRFGNPLDGSVKMFEGCMDALQARGDALEEFRVGIGFWSAHSVFREEWAQDSGWLASDL